MNRTWEEPDDEDDSLIERTSNHLVRTTKDISDQGPLMLGECPIVIDSPETALEGSQWGYERARKLLIERGLSEEKAHTIAEDFRKKQYKEMLATVTELEEKSGPANWN